MSRKHYTLYSLEYVYIGRAHTVKATGRSTGSAGTSIKSMKSKTAPMAQTIAGEQPVDFCGFVSLFVASYCIILLCISYGLDDDGITRQHSPINSLRMRIRSCSVAAEMMTQLMKASKAAW